MKCAIIRDSNCWLCDGAYYSGDTFLQFVNDLARELDEVILFLPAKRPADEAERMEAVKRKKVVFEVNVRVIPTYPYRNTYNFYRHFPEVYRHNRRAFRENVRGADIALLFVPHNNDLIAYGVLKALKMPYMVYVIGDVKEIISGGDKYKGLMRLLSVAAANFESWFYKLLIRRSVGSFFLGSALKGIYGSEKSPSYSAFTSLVAEDEVYRRNPTPMEDGKVRLLYIGRTAHEKGLGHLLAAVEALYKEDGLDVHLRVCGDGHALIDLKAESARRGLAGRVEFMGFVPKGVALDGILAESDVFVLPSLSEGVPKVLIEAMSYGLPIIATDVGGVPDIIKHGENGFLIKPGTAAEIATAVKMIARDGALREKLVDGGLRFAREHTSSKQAGSIVNVMRERLAAGRGCD